jgi:branched-chain amino acid transport system substrate-binding protein
MLGMKKRVAVVAAAVAVTLALAACSSGTGSSGGSGSSAKSPYLIGGALSSSGTAAFIGQDALAGANIAVKEINAAGGVKGHPLKAVWLDDQASPAVGVTDFNKLVSQGVKFQLAQVTPVISAIKPLAARNQVLLMNHAGTDPSFADASNYIITNIATANQEAKTLIDYIAKNTKVRTLGVLLQSSATGDAILAALHAATAGTRIKIVATQRYDQSATVFSSQLVALKSAHPDAMYADFFSPQTTVDVLQQAKSMGFSVPVFSDTFFEDASLPGLAGSLINGVTYSDVGFNPNQNAVAKNFQKEWTAAGNKGVPPIYAATAYDAVKLIAYAIGKVGYNPDKARAAITSVTGFKGATGSLSFSTNGQVSMAVQIKKVVNGKFTVVKQ